MKLKLSAVILTLAVMAVIHPPARRLLRGTGYIGPLGKRSYRQMERSWHPRGK